MNSMRLRIVALGLFLFSTPVAASADTFTGAWNGNSFAGGGVYPNSFAFVQRGKRIIGSGWAGSANGPGVIVGTLKGGQLTIRSNYKKLHYGSTANATVSGNSLAGTFLDSQGTSGTWSAQREDGVLRSSTVLAAPPVVEVTTGRVVVTLVKFNSVAPINGKISYQLVVSGRSFRSSSNTFTFLGLKPGTYSAYFRVTAKPSTGAAFTLTRSPAARFSAK